MVMHELQNKLQIKCKYYNTKSDRSNINVEMITGGDGGGGNGESKI